MFLYEMTVPYDLKAEREGRDAEAHEVWFTSDVEFIQGDKIEYGDRLLEVANRRPVINRGHVVKRRGRRPRPSKNAVPYIKLFCYNA